MSGSCSVFHLAQDEDDLLAAIEVAAGDLQVDSLVFARVAGQQFV